MSVIWHDIECGAYSEDLALWRTLADTHGDPILDVGAGTGRVALDLARRGHRVIALDRDPALIAELSGRAEELPVKTTVADARSFELARRVPLCIVPMQTIQLLGGQAGRRAFLDCSHRHLLPGGVLAAALTSALEPYDLPEGALGPLPDLRELDGTVYASQPVAVREEADGYVLERRREIVTPAGRRSVEANRVRLDRVDAAALELEAQEAGFTPAGRAGVSQTADYAGSIVVMLRA